MSEPVSEDFFDNCERNGLDILDVEDLMFYDPFDTYDEEEEYEV